ncbi:hypothetical protein JMJ77_0012328 [Colletotrichum scovillei]|uniref:Uncharacterized protein n=1 Tax=Colletotrichum scovillei TaxID=1209932 RepID=A0A9P7QRS6_9PEZI|nr:hypothetical protein JMJ78_0001383 [Colletotrichum scovillei]KAG7041810.1 hypothetical protein JMJ77_0012328 [Colletotrichum scovillei]KAG7061841.1 hypothetical protein JMJ76_0003797 [Colletotrichum scovillei]
MSTCRRPRQRASKIGLSPPNITRLGKAYGVAYHSDQGLGERQPAHPRNGRKGASSIIAWGTYRNPRLLWLLISRLKDRNVDAEESP